MRLLLDAAVVVLHIVVYPIDKMLDTNDDAWCKTRP